MSNYDYTGGGLGGPNRHMAEAIRAVRNGDTVRQRNQAMMDKALLHGAMTITNVGGQAIAADIDHRKDLENQANRAIRKSSEQYAAPDVAQAKDTSHVPEWLRQAQEDPEGAAQAAKARANVNTSAALANIGGYQTQAGVDNQDIGAQAMARDIGTAKQTMEQGGMMNSLSRRQDPGY